MNITNYNANTNTAFNASGRNPSFIGAAFDYSFVGFTLNSGGNRKLVTAVGKHLVVAAKHYALNNGDVITFYNRDNKPVTAKVTDGSKTVDDVQLAVVDTDLVAAGITIPKIANYSNSQLKSKPTLVFGLDSSKQNFVGALNAVASAQAAGSGAMALQSQRNGVAIDFGDSGAPDFVINGGVLELIGPHYSVTPTYFYTSTVAPYSSQIS